MLDLERDYAYGSFVQTIKGPPRWALSEADLVCGVANFVIPTKHIEVLNRKIEGFLFFIPPDACIIGWYGKQKALDLERDYAYESFVQTRHFTPRYRHFTPQ